MDSGLNGHNTLHVQPRVDLEQEAGAEIVLNQSLVANLVLVSTKKQPNVKFKNVQVYFRNDKNRVVQLLLLDIWIYSFSIKV